MLAFSTRMVSTSATLSPHYPAIDILQTRKSGTEVLMIQIRYYVFIATSAAKTREITAGGKSYSRKLRYQQVFPCQ
jgi:hypothetical protein